MNLPNKITLTRIILIPFIIFFYLATFVPFGKLIALILFIVAILTDFLDGKLARKLKLVTTIGKFMDSIADKMVTLSMFAIILCMDGVYQPIGVVSFVIILCRELIVSALRQLAAAGNVIIAADMWGKVKATFQFFTIAFFMLLAFLLETFNLSTTLFNILNITCYVMLGITIVVTIVSGLHYLIKNRQVFNAQT